MLNVLYEAIITGSVSGFERLAGGPDPRGRAVGPRNLVPRRRSLRGCPRVR